MAWTVTKYHSVHGNMRAVMLDITTDGQEALIYTGLSRIDAMILGPSSCNTGPQWIAVNSGTTGTAIAGALGCSGFTSGDRFFVTVYGRS